MGCVPQLKAQLLQGSSLHITSLTASSYPFWSKGERVLSSPWVRLYPLKLSVTPSAFVHGFI